MVLIEKVLVGPFVPFFFHVASAYYLLLPQKINNDGIYFISGLQSSLLISL